MKKRDENQIKSVHWGPHMCVVPEHYPVWYNKNNVCVCKN